MPPLSLALEPETLEIDGTSMRAAVTVRLYDFGIAALLLIVGGLLAAWRREGS